MIALLNVQMVLLSWDISSLFDSKRGMLDSSLFCVSELCKSCKDCDTFVRPLCSHDFILMFKLKILGKIFMNNNLASRKTIFQAPVVQKLDSAIHRINPYPADKYYGSQLRYPLESDLSGG